MYFWGESIVEYFSKQVRSGKLDLTGRSAFLVMQLLKGQRTDRSLKDCELLRTLYLAIVEPFLKATGIAGSGIPFFVWAKLSYEASVINAAINKLTKSPN